MTAIQVKCYLFPDNVNVEFASVAKANEIRRFNLATDPGSKGIYNQLVDKIGQSFGDLLPNKESIRTYWQDDENELVGFSSDTELQYAIDLQTAIRLSKPYDRQQSQSMGSGSLFKVYVARKKSEAAKDSEEKEPLHFGVVCDACNGSIVGIRYKCAICPDYDLCSSCKSKGAHRDTEHAFNVIEKPNFWKPFQYRRNGGGRCPYKSQCRTQPHGQQQASADASAASAGAHAGFQNPFGNIFAPFMSGANVPLVNDPEQLKNIGESLKKFLDPFGVDVDYYVDSFNRAARPNAENKPAEKKEAEATAESKGPEKMATEEAPKQPEPTKMDVEKNEAPAAAAAAAATPSQDADLIKLNGSSPFAAASEALNNFLVKQSEAQTVQPNAPAEEPAVIPKPAPPKEESIEESFNLVDIEKELKIIKAIEQLKSMGYSDDGGWLTRLATAKEGNINAVLDAISPSLPHTRN